MQKPAACQTRRHKRRLSYIVYIPFARSYTISDSLSLSRSLDVPLAVCSNSPPPLFVWTSSFDNSHKTGDMRRAQAPDPPGPGALWRKESQSYASITRTCTKTYTHGAHRTMVQRRPPHEILSTSSLPASPFSLLACVGAARAFPSSSPYVRTHTHTKSRRATISLVPNLKSVRASNFTPMHTSSFGLFVSP